MKLTKTRSEAYDYYRGEDGTEYRISSIRFGQESNLQFEFLSPEVPWVESHWEPVEDKEIESALLDAWATS
jgi:hypothetical protein